MRWLRFYPWVLGPACIGFGFFGINTLAPLVRADGEPIGMVSGDDFWNLSLIHLAWVSVGSGLLARGAAGAKSPAVARWVQGAVAAVFGAYLLLVFVALVLLRTLG